MIVFWRVHCTFPPTNEHVDLLVFCVFLPKLCILWTYYKMGCWCNLIRLALTRLITSTNKERLRSLKPINEPDHNRKIVSFRSCHIASEPFLVGFNLLLGTGHFFIFFSEHATLQMPKYIWVQKTCPAKTSSMPRLLLLTYFKLFLENW